MTRPLILLSIALALSGCARSMTGIVESSSDPVRGTSADIVWVGSNLRIERRSTPAGTQYGYRTWGRAYDAPVGANELVFLLDGERRTTLRGHASPESVSAQGGFVTYSVEVWFPTTPEQIREVAAADRVEMGFYLAGVPHVTQELDAGKAETFRTFADRFIGPDIRASR